METKKPQRLEVPRVLDRETGDKVAFMTFIIEKFASAFKMGGPEAYLYLKKYGGLDYVNDCWWALHIDNPYWALREMFVVCKNNGGLR